jgi:Cu(I)/Ag(I) efflux system membrane fusion protein
MKRAWMMIGVLLLALAAPTVAVEPTGTGVPAHEHGGRQLYTCGMHPQVIRDAPGTCPICGMELTPLTPEGPLLKPAEGTVVIDPAVVQNMGVRTAVVQEGALHRRVRAAATVAEPDPDRLDVTLRVSGWIERLYADVDGMAVAAGDPLFDLYSPELQVAIGELIAARRALPAEAAHGAAALVYAAARQKLALLGLDRTEIDRLGRLEQPPATVTFRSPIGGHVFERNVLQGDAVQAGERVLRLADRRRMWIDARVFEQDLALVAVGARAVATLPALPGERIEGTISFVHPHLDPVTRTALARMVVDNPGMHLRRGMYATMEIDAPPLPRAVLAPRQAVIETGTEAVVFLVQPAGHFEPRRVTVGASGDAGLVEIVAGLTPGDEVVTSGQFLIDAESNFRMALQRFLTTLPADTAPAGAPHVH